MLSSRLLLYFPSGIFPSGFPTKKPVCISPRFQACYMPCHLIPVSLIILIIFGDKNMLWSSIQSPIILYIFGPDILLSTLSAHTLSLCCFFNVRDQVSRPNKMTSNVIVLKYITHTNTSALDGRKSE
jgi:hypothetical protein